MKQAVADPVDTSPPLSPRSPLRMRIIVFTLVCLFAVALTILGLVLAMGERSDLTSSSDTVAASGEPLIRVPMPGDDRSLLFENTASADRYGQVAAVRASEPGGPRRVAEMDCERVDFRAGKGVCLQTDRGFLTTYDAVVFDADFREMYRLGLAGSPSRVRVSPTGSLAAATVFVTGHSYAVDGFSTQTLILDLTDGNVVADLETDFTVKRDGGNWRSVDFNFWGVTFRDDEHFYATLGTGGQYYLLDGDLTSRTMNVVQDGVECPSLSPDGTRLAYKIRSDSDLGPATWRIGVLDLAMMETTVLAETRSVDDQVAWLDDETVMYGLPNEDSPAEADTWAVPADGSGEPGLLVAKAWSTVVVGG
jgi:hypothetical protein